MNRKKTLLLILLLIAIGVVVYSVIRKGNIDKQGDDVNSDNIASNEEVVEEDSFFNDDGNVEHNLKLTIIGPEEKIIYPGQARMYNALVEGNGKYATTIRCNWKFYLDENNGEVLYKEQDTTGVLSGASKEVCGFTSTFIDRIGTLRVMLTMTVYDAVDDNLETISAERQYIVQR